MNSPKFWLAMLAAASCSLFGDAHADVTQADEYMRRLKISQTVQPHGDTPFGEQVNLYTGELTFQQADIVLEGKGPALSLVRDLSSLQTRGLIKRPFVMGDWMLSIPRIETLTDAPLQAQPLGSPGANWVVASASDPNRYARCTHLAESYSPRLLASIWWNGIELIAESGHREQILARSPQNTAQPSIVNNGQPVVFPGVTRGHWQIGCLAATSNGEIGEAFLAVSPEGTKYWFDHLVGERAETIYEQDNGVVLRQPRMLATMYVTRIEDRFGNYLTYQYSGDKLTAITASDGRSATVQWRADAHLIDSITLQPAAAQPRVWRYEYVNIASESAVLSGVVLPDGSRWGFDLQPAAATPLTHANLSKCTTRTLANGATGSPSTVTHPSGAVGKFWLTATWHSRSYVPSTCIHPVYPQEFEPYEDIPPLFGTWSLSRKEFSGPGLSTSAWTYSYSAAAGSTLPDACAGQGNCAATVWTDVVGPDANRTRYTHSNRWGETEGKLLQTDAYQGASTLLRSESLTYAAANAGPYPSLIGSALTSGLSNNAKDITWTPLNIRATSQQGVTFTWQATAFNTFAKVTNEIRHSTLGYSRSDVTGYYNDTTRWVIGQVASSTNTNTGLIESQTDYWPNTALPQRTWSFGKPQQYFVYNADGTLASVTDGRNLTTSFANWKRGIPQTITFADNAVKSAVVDDLGQITSVTNEVGAKTCYGYDVMGRVSSITQPSEVLAGACNQDNWLATTIIFAPSGSAAYGLPTGHWRRTEATGNARKITFYDAMWRPVVQEVYDASNTNNTLTQTVTRYDSDGRTLLTSYPQRTLDPNVYNTWANPAVVANLTGSTMEYDALGRPTIARWNSELGVLFSTTQYLNNFVTLATDARGQQTSTGYMAYDQPTTDWPAAIAHPEGAFTHITRDKFGKPLSITRHNADNSQWAGRHIAYYPSQQICKTSEVETGTTAYGYDGAGNLTWTAAALPWSPEAPCQYTSTHGIVVPKRVDRTYDVRNRLSTLSFPDGLGDQTWTYTPDGLPDTLTAYNEAGHTAPVITAYAYNKRRLLNGQGEVVSQPNFYSWGIGYGYDVYGNLASHAYPTGLTVAYSPNALGQATQVVGGGTNFATGVGYHPNGAIKQFTYGNGIVHTLTQNAQQLPDTSCDFYGGVCGASATLNDGYDYDQNGNVVAISDGRTLNRGNRTMTYDGLDRLKTTASPMFGNAAYTYNTLDDLTRVTIGGSAARDHYYCYDAHYQLTNIKTGSCNGASVIGLGYDDRGNLANKNGVLYQFDYGNRLREVVGVERYRYDTLGRRVETTKADQTQRLWQYSQAGQLMFGWTGPNNPTTHEYVYLAGSLVAIVDHAGPDNAVTAVKYQHTDALGSPVAVTDANRVVIEQSEYEPYGYLLNRPLMDGPGYAGHVSDAATGMSYMQQRYYDPKMGGRFLSVDPVTATSVGGNFNRYWYANNNPYRFTDPDGRQSIPTPQNFNVDMSKRVPNEVSNAWKIAEQAATPKTAYATGTAGEAAGGGLVGGKAQVASGTVALGVKGASANVSGPEALISTPAGSVRLQASSQGVEKNTLNAAVVGAHASPVGYEVGISSLLTAKAIDNLDIKTTINLPGLSASWGANKSDAGWAIGISIAKPSAALSFVRTENKPSDP